MNIWFRYVVGKALGVEDHTNNSRRKITSMIATSSNVKLIKACWVKKEKSVRGSSREEENGSKEK